MYERVTADEKTIGESPRLSIHNNSNDTSSASISKAHTHHATAPMTPACVSIACFDPELLILRGKPYPAPATQFRSHVSFPF